jgi:unsaturated rhamnogalacturonyl hydrolase
MPVLCPHLIALLVPFFLLAPVCGGQGVSSQATAPSESIAIRFADWILQEWPEPERMTTKGWEYTNGIVMHGLEKVYEKTSDTRYLAYIKRFVDFHVDRDGNVDLGKEHNLDRIQPGVLLLLLYEQTGDNTYRLAANRVRAAVHGFPRNASGGFWHKARYPDEMWVDGIYMAQPFLVKYGRLFGDEQSCFDTAVGQVKLISRHVQDPRTGLVRHAWDEDRNAAWADPQTGLAPEIWSRGAGWFAMALVDILRFRPADHPGVPELMAILQKLAEGLKQTQDLRTGLWFQVMDQGNRPDNWLETSGSAMFVYALKLGVDNGYLDRSNLEVARKGWAGLRSRISFSSDGLPVISEAAGPMGVQVDYANYVNRPRLQNSPHALCAVLMAATQMEF